VAAPRRIGYLPELFRYPEWLTGREALRFHVRLHGVDSCVRERFLDEPASALDPRGRHEVRNLLLRLREEGKTIFLNTHLLEDVEAVCTSVARLMEGRVRAYGTVDEILRPHTVWEYVVGG
jgi:ABC-2 type transport system ATP-binding protein